jgi:predicted pyridoxine 5'-phosphate oxidase superfamily flavin-nucleotide-binding protein
MITPDIQAAIDRSVLSWLATVDPHGMPNVSPKEVFCSFGQNLVLIANIASPTSVRNLQTKPNACLSFVDVFVQKGYKLQGVAEVVASTDARYPQLSVPLVAITRGLFLIHSIIALTVRSAEQILAPSYRLIPGTTEDSQVEAALRAYGVCRIRDA